MDKSTVILFVNSFQHSLYAYVYDVYVVLWILLWTFQHLTNELINELIEMFDTSSFYMYKSHDYTFKTIFTVENTYETS